MCHKGFPGVERIEVTDGYKQGFRYLLTPKCAKENRITILGWHVRTSDFKELVNDPEWRELLHFTWLTVSVDGDLYDHYMWIGGFVGGLSGYRKVDPAELVGESIAALKLRAPVNPGLGSYHQFITKNDLRRGHFPYWRQVRVGITWRQYALRPTLSGKRDPPHIIRAIRWTKGLVYARGFLSGDTVEGRILYRT